MGAIFQRRGQVFRFSWDVSDPRLQGMSVSLISADIADIVHDTRAVIWADDILWNAEGTWVGRVTGTKDDAGVHWLSLTSFGTGAYAGLQHIDHLSGPGDAWPVNGRIEPAQAESAPAETTRPAAGTPSRGSGTCHESLAATPASPGQTRAWLLDCTSTNADPRLAGRQLVLVDADVQADGTADFWGVTVIWNEQGTWDGSWTGRAGAGWPESGVDLERDARRL